MYSISGYAKIIVADDTLPSKDLILELKPGYHIIETDSLGFFEFKDLKKGIYILKYIYDGSKNNEFNINIENKSVKNFSIIYNSNCQFNRKKALEDIKNNNIRLIVISGIALYYHNDDKVDEKKFNFKYHFLGCIIEDFECMKQYNQTIFNFFDKKYGDKWRNDIREDVYFLNGSKYGE
ncbi:hypothetical protein EV195_10784 [Tenacibaculum skagerrakense]|uniref:Carboxypeptidase family protein n=1 Tax=Tenacibaculum skagerrakense TaxID=186571 RepID=A0A4R2NQ06_9FLAO|nr:hypothetical protein [Tenacibaculum skagerrakense]TCP23919.1 hypothetical protein EV195_10784 [Tenacibaculum skagerrakense]